MKVVIIKGDKTITTTKTAFDSYFKNNGWKVAEESATNQPEFENDENSKVDEIDEWDEVTDDEVTKPISEMTRDEMISFAESKGIEIPDGIKTRQIKEIIEANM